MRTEGLSSALLLLATTLALLWANSPSRAGYDVLRELVCQVQIGPIGFGTTLRDAVNDGLMTIFFLVIGLEIKHELVAGELSGIRHAALPAAAALGGMAAPALIFAALNWGGDGLHGWAIPTATDIAFALGALASVRGGAGSSRRVFLLALAIVDDLGAIVIIALFYGHGFAFGPLIASAGFLALFALVARAGLNAPMTAILAAAGAWACFLGSGLHPTLAGVALGLLVPTQAWTPLKRFAAVANRLIALVERAQAQGRTTRAEALLGWLETWTVGTEPPLDRLQRSLHGWSSFLVLPLFAFLNAGVAIDGNALSYALQSRVGWGVALGLLVGKPVGVWVGTRLAERLGLAARSEVSEPRNLLGVGMLTGVGFTVALFVTGLAFADDPQNAAAAKIAILAASLVSSIAGVAVLSTGRRRSHA